jgi:phosphohistidine swiveling domain-containing protein
MDTVVRAGCRCRHHSGTLAAHASLVAREYGIPAVVGTGDATMRLQPGQLVTVDGTAGTDTPHQQPAEA